MKTVTVNLNSIEKVKSFVNDIVKYENDFDLVSGRNYLMQNQLWGYSPLICQNLYNLTFMLTTIVINHKIIKKLSLLIRNQFI